MIDPAFARTMAAYNRWMNERIYAACAGIPDAERRRDRGAFFRSLHGTLNHLLWADRLWLSRFTARPAPPGARHDVELYADFDELRRERASTDEEIDAFAASLTPERLAGDLHYVPFSSPEPRTIPMSIVVSHFFNHQTHHRGQATTLMMQCGVDPGVTDLPWLPGIGRLARS